ncbi:MAG TPA: PIN domain-containing protein [Candidatus Thermoplasmatota archaeon]|nr:PIN domain-containing protein [Candidatus Thermoplasmatota archaeon]
MTILLDTGFIFALLNHEDAAHGPAADLASRIGRREWGTPLVTELVVAELFSLIRARTGSAKLEEAARQWLPLPNPSLRGLTLAPVGGALLEKSWEVFAKYRDQRLSFTDASLLALAEAMRVERIATFDRGLSSLARTIP